jgi:hypothetical protein
MALESLTYEIRWLDPGFRMTPRKLELPVGDFDCFVDGDQITAVPKSVYPDARAGAAALEPHLRAWELQLELEQGHRVEFRLSGSAAKEVAPDGTKHYQIGLNEYIGMSSSVSVGLVAAIPAPAGGYQSGPLTSRYLVRLRDLRAGRDRVTQVAYAIVSDLEQTYGGLPQAAGTLQVSRGLLVEVKKLSSGQHPTEGRKSASGGVALTDENLAWLGRAVAHLVRRTAQVEAGTVGLPQLTVADI